MKYGDLFFRIAEKLQHDKYTDYLTVKNFKGPMDDTEGVKEGLNVLQDKQLIVKTGEGQYKMVETDNLTPYQEALDINPGTRRYLETQV